MNDYGELVYIYDLENHILIKNVNISSIEDIKKIVNDSKNIGCFKIKNFEDFQFNNLNISFNYFPWKTYYNLNPELLSNNLSHNNHITAWNHWQYYGKKEERAFSIINNTNVHRARFGNLFFLNMCLSMFSQKFDLKCSYKNELEFNKLGIYFQNGRQIYKKNLLLTDYNFENVLESDISSRNIIINNSVWFHTNRFCKIIQTYFEKHNLFKNVRKSNLYKDRYNNNNDLFIHVRLGDVSDKTVCLQKYYTNMLEKQKFNRGFISSDSLNHPLCKKLIQKYKLNVIDTSEVETIMFGSTCKHIILTGGTFSWLIAFFALSSSHIFYPDLNDKWYGDIFSFSNWNKIFINEIDLV